MALKTLRYTVSVNGINPVNEQFGGVQGDHRVTEIEIYIQDDLFDTIVDSVPNGSVMYRFDVYDGTGGVWQSEPKEIDTTVKFTLEERHTRFGGKITIHLVITALSMENKPEIELYSFPMVLRLKNRPDGVYQEGENRNSVTALCELAKKMAREAAESASTARDAAGSAVREFAVTLEETLKNLTIDGITSDDNTLYLEAPATEDTYIYLGDFVEIGSAQGIVDFMGSRLTCVGEPTMNSDAANKEYVDESAKFSVPRIPESETLGPPKALVVKGNAGLMEIDGQLYPNDNDYQYLAVDWVGLKDITGSPHSNVLAMRDGNGNLYTYEPVDDVDCVNKGYIVANYYTRNECDNYFADFDSRTNDALTLAILTSEQLKTNYYTMNEIDTIIGDIETLLGGI